MNSNDVKNKCLTERGRNGNGARLYDCACYDRIS